MSTWAVWLVVTLLALLAFKLSGAVRFYVKAIATVLFYSIGAVAIMPYCLLHLGQYTDNMLFGAKLFSWGSKLIGLRWTIENQNSKEELRDKAFIVVCNHQSFIDVFGVLEIWPLLHPAVGISKKELKYLSGPLGISMALCGAIFINRANNEKGRKAVNDASKWAKENKTSILLFPEGTRNASGGMLPFKKGAFHMALDGGMPILPVVIDDYRDVYNAKEKRFETHRDIKITVLKSIETEGVYSKDNIDDLIKATRDVMLAELNRGKKKD